MLKIIWVRVRHTAVVYCYVSRRRGRRPHGRHGHDKPRVGAQCWQEPSRSRPAFNFQLDSALCRWRGGGGGVGGGGGG